MKFGLSHKAEGYSVRMNFYGAQVYTTADRKLRCSLGSVWKSGCYIPGRNLLFGKAIAGTVLRTKKARGMQTPSPAAFAFIRGYFGLFTTLETR
jgi:hypothetical protein